MVAKVIHLVDQRNSSHLPRVPDVPHVLKAALGPVGPLADARGRPLRDLRISVTDRCNFRCSYCMPKEIFDKRYAFLPHDALLSFEEIERVARLFVSHGVCKIRLTGGEPLLRKDLERLVGMLAELRTRDGDPLDLALTTNGSVLARKAQALKDAGLRRVTVSLDALDDAVFRKMNDADFPVAAVLAGIDAAQRAGLGPIKVNMVVKRGVNEDQIVPMARHFKGSGAILRFIEYMDVGATNGWRLNDVLPSDELIARVHTAFPLKAVAPGLPGETAERWRYADGDGEIGVISSVTHAFCESCNRARLSTEGQLFTCLFASRGHDVRALLRAGHTDAEIAGAIGLIWQERDDRYSEARSTAVEPERATTEPAERRVEMHYIGG